MEQLKRESVAFNLKLNGFEFAYFILSEYLCTMEFHIRQV